MDNKNNNEMEQIQQGLEAFLEKELDIIGTSGNERQRNGAGRTRRAEHNGNESRTERMKASPGSRPGRREEDFERIHIIGQDFENEYNDEYDDAYDGEETFYENEDESYRQKVSQSEGQTGRSQMRRESSRMQEGITQQRQSQARRNPKQKEGTDSREVSQPRRAAQNQKRRRPQGEEFFREERVYPEEYSEEEFSQAGRSKKRKRSIKQEQVPEEDFQMAKPAKSSKSQKKKKKKSRWKKILIVVVILAALLGVGWYQLVGAVYSKMNYSEIASVTGMPMQEDGVVNILLIGNDSRENGADGRSDAMILLSISSRTKTIYMTSLLRDMYVEIPGHDDNRLNAAYSFGGAELLMETVEKNFDIPVNRYMLVNFEGFANLVDTVGGIELELTSEEIEYVNGYLVEYNMLTDRPQGTDNMDPSVSGLVHLNGPQALAYSRNRYLGTDFGRTDRQRKVLTAVIKKLPSVMLTNAGELMDELLPNLTTNLTQNECFRLSLMAGKLLTYDIVSDSIPQPGTYSDATIRKMAVLEVDFDANIKYLKEKIYGE